MTDMFSLVNKVAVVTGGGSGIGLATAKRFIKAGAKVVIATRSDNKDLAASFGAEFVRTDVANEEQVKNLMQVTADKFGRIDVLVNNAGMGDVGKGLTEASNESFVEHFSVNTLGIINGIRHALPHMPRGSSIINVSSLAGLTALPGYGCYTASKWAAIGVTRTAALELASQDIRVNAICPGTIDTPINNHPGAEAELKFVKTATPAGRMGDAEEVAALIHFLAADDCKYINGESIVIDGGWMAGISIPLIETVMSAQS